MKVGGPSMNGIVIDLENTWMILRIVSEKLYLGWQSLSTSGFLLKI